MGTNDQDAPDDGKGRWEVDPVTAAKPATIGDLLLVATSLAKISAMHGHCIIALANDDRPLLQARLEQVQTFLDEAQETMLQIGKFTRSDRRDGR